MPARAPQGAPIDPPLEDILQAVGAEIQTRFFAFGTAVAAIGTAVSAILQSLLASAEIEGSSTISASSGVRHARLLAESREMSAGLLAAREQLQSMDSLTHSLVETTVHLRSCSVTLKVVGARYPEISGFAGEMVASVNRIRAACEAARQDIDGCLRAMADADLPASASAATDPALAGLSNGLDPVNLRRTLDAIALKAGDMMSELQIGDVTAQRLDHVCRSLAFIGEGGLDDREAARFMALVGDQLRQTNDDLGRAVELLAGQAGQLQEWVLACVGDSESCQTQWRAASTSAARSAELQSQEGDVLRRWYGEVAAVLSPDNGLHRNVEHLGGQIETIRSGALDIFYMALNSTLSCRRLGGEAEASTPITAEARGQSGPIADTTDALASTLAELAARFSALADTSKTTIAEGLLAAGDSDQGQPRANSASTFAAIADLPRIVAQLSGEGRALKTASQALAETCLTLPEEQSFRKAAGLSDQAQALSAAMMALYTMESERALHRRHFGQVMLATGPLAEPAEDKGFDLATALF